MFCCRGEESCLESCLIVWGDVAPLVAFSVTVLFLQTNLKLNLAEEPGGMGYGRVYEDRIKLELELE